jgi:hypothetical protein
MRAGRHDRIGGLLLKILRRIRRELIEARAATEIVSRALVGQGMLGAALIDLHAADGINRHIGR